MNSNKLCHICLSPLIGKNKKLTCKCDIEYHKICIDKWLRQKSECPICHEKYVKTFSLKKAIINKLKKIKRYYRFYKNRNIIVPINETNNMSTSNYIYRSQYINQMGRETSLYYTRQRVNERLNTRLNRNRRRRRRYVTRNI